MADQGKPTGPPRSIQWQITARQLPLLGLLFAVALLWLGAHLRTVLYDANLEAAERSGQVAVSAVQLAMVTDDAHPVWDRVVQQIPQDQPRQIEIVNTEGEVLFSTSASDRGARRDIEGPTCAACHGVSTAGEVAETAFVRDPADEGMQLFAAPLRNDERCQGCHPAEQGKLGMVLVRQSLAPINAEIRQVLITLAIFGGLAFLLVIFTTRTLLARFLGRPLRQLIEGASAIGAGELEHEIQLSSNSELSVLADTLNSSTQRLATLQAEIIERERLVAIGETMAGTAHCIKNMLNGLKGGQYVIDRAIATGDLDKLGRAWPILKNSVSSLERLSLDMLHYVKDRSPALEQVDLNQVTLEVVELMQDSASRVDVALRAELADEACESALDRTAIYRALVNLTCNAIDACHEADAGDLVTLRTYANGDEIGVTVEDNGVGMTAEVQDQIFTRFFSTKASRGTGLGLHVVKKIAGEHGGSLEVQSTPGEGSSFRLLLPRVSSPPG